MQKKLLGDYQGYIFDLDGTIYLGEELIPNARATIEALKQADKKIVYLSNKPLETRGDYAEKLTRLGIPTSEDDVINSSYVMANYLRENAPGATLYVIGEAPLKKELAEAGMVVVDDPPSNYAAVDVVIASFDRTFDYAKLNHALQALREGARFIATNGDRTCPVEGGEIPDAGGVIGAIEGTTGRELELIVGKPNVATAAAAWRRLGLQAEDCLMVGDRLETDIRMGVETGMGAALVLTGVASRSDANSVPWKPHFVLESVFDIVKSL